MVNGNFVDIKQTRFNNDNEKAVRKGFIYAAIK